MRISENKKQLKFISRKEILIVARKNSKFQHSTVGIKSRKRKCFREDKREVRDRMSR